MSDFTAGLLVGLASGLALALLGRRPPSIEVKVDASTSHLHEAADGDFEEADEDEDEEPLLPPNWRGAAPDAHEED